MLSTHKLSLYSLRHYVFGVRKFHVHLHTEEPNLFGAIMENIFFSRERNANIHCTFLISYE